MSREEALARESETGASGTKVSLAELRQGHLMPHPDGAVATTLLADPWL